ncbi:hypothetical protein HRD84_13210 [Enterococcus faecalis]|nr:hypothetical protein [Enterococcus faecalis]
MKKFKQLYQLPAIKIPIMVLGIILSLYIGIKIASFILILFDLDKLGFINFM